MYRFWETVIEPLLEMIKPRTIVEVGSDTGANTRNLLNYCQRNGATLHVVDPLPKYDASAYREHYGEHLVFHQSASLDALPFIERIDAVLIDGDHNWYTVFNELKLLEDKCESQGHTFPLTMLHDVGWPYGRRDLYYAPETIPEPHRKPYDRKGLRPESAEPVEEGGLNWHLYNAVQQDEKSGVLTAIEDFLHETECQLELLTVPGIHGLGLLMDADLKKQNEEFAKLVESLNFSETTTRHIARVESSRLKSEIGRQEYRLANEKLRAEYSEQISGLQEQLQDKEREISALDEQRAHQVSSLEKKVKQESKEKQVLVRWIEQLEHGISALLGSRQWQTGHALGELRRQALRQPRVPMAQDHLRNILQEFHDWRGGRNNSSAQGKHQGFKQTKHSPAESASSSRNGFISAVKQDLAQGGIRAVKDGVVSEVHNLKPRISKKKLAEQIRHRLGPAPELHTAPLVSIIVLNRNGLGHLKKLFAGLRDNTDYPEFEVVLVDNGSTDGSVEFVKSFEAGFPVELIENPGNTSYSAGNNQGGASASGDLLLFLNNDVEPFEDGWLREMVSRMQRTRAGAVGAFLLYPGRTEYSVSSGYAVQHRGIKFHKTSARVSPYNFSSEYPLNLEGDDALGERLGEDTACPAVTAACLLMERDTFEGAGGFETGYRYGGEDVDLCLGLHFAGREIVCSGRTVLFHDESTSQDDAGKHFRRINRKINRQLFKERWGPLVSREFYRDRLGSGEFWTEEKPHIAITLTSLDMNDGYGDWYTGHEIGDALQVRGWRVSYVQKKNDEYYSLPDGVDYVLALLHWYDASRVSDVTTIAWIRNWTERWVEHPWFEHFDVVLASSTISKEIVESRTGKAASVFPIAANPKRFQRTLPNPTYEADYVFTGNHWGAGKGEQRLVEVLDPEQDETVMIFGKGWEHVPRVSRYDCGHLSYDRLPQVYSSAKLVIDDAGHTTRPYGSVNSRVFDALATGTLVVSSCKEGVRELFDKDFPTYDDRKELRENLDILLNDDSRREELAARYQDIVLREHTYTKRAEQLTELLRQRVEALSFCIKIGPRNWEKAPWWGDLHYARAMQRQLESRGHPCTVQVLEEWDDFEGLEYDVAIHLKGLEPYTTKPAQFNVLWNISHPDLLTSRECDKYDLVFVASERFAQELRPGTDTPIVVLEQATDPQVFYPEHDAEHERDLVFVGNSRKVERRILRDLLPTKHDLGVWGGNWEGLIPDRHILGQYLPNDEVRRAYTSASIVLNDHWDDMREHGFVSNRIYDALACGALVISDDLPEIKKSFGDAVVTYSTPEELEELVEHYLNSPQERADKGKKGRELMLQRHTFEHRMSEFLEHVLNVLQSTEISARVRSLALDSSRQRLMSSHKERE